VTWRADIGLAKDPEETKKEGCPERAIKRQGEVHDISESQKNGRCYRELVFNRSGEKTFQASQRQLHATVGEGRGWVVAHDMKAADTIQIVYDGRILYCAPQEDTVATKIRDRYG